MATRLPKQLAAGAQLTTSAVPYYTVPANTVTTISACSLCNSTAAAKHATVYLVPSGGSPSASNIVLSQRVIAAGETYNVSAVIGQSIPAGATIQALAESGTAITIVASGYETNS